MAATRNKGKCHYGKWLELKGTFSQALKYKKLKEIYNNETILYKY